MAQRDGWTEAFGLAAAECSEITVIHDRASVAQRPLTRAGWRGGGRKLNGRGVQGKVPSAHCTMILTPWLCNPNWRAGSVSDRRAAPVAHAAGSPGEAGGPSWNK